MKTKNKPFKLTVRGVVQDDSGRYLIMQRSADSKIYPLSWEFPGGKVDPNEDFATALIREFKEETNLEIELTEVLGTAQRERETFMTAYLFMRVQILAGEVVCSHEHKDFKWVTKKELAQIDFAPHLIPLVRKLLNES